MRCSSCDSTEKACYCETEALRRCVRALANLVHEVVILSARGALEGEADRIAAELRVIDS